MALTGAFTCLVALVATGVVSHLLPAARTLDADTLDAFTRLREYDVDGLLEAVVHLGDPLPYLLLAAAIVVAAVARERPRLALAVGVVLVAAPATAEILKILTAQAREHSVVFADHVNSASWPSGHATGAMTAALCAVLVSPRQLRPLVAVAGGLYALAVGYAVIALVWHFPSDTIGAFLLSATWCLLAVAALRRWPDPVAQDARRPSVAPGLAGAAVALVAAGVLVLSYVRPGEIRDGAAAHTTLFGAAIAIAALAAVLAAALVRSARGDER